MKSSLSTEPLDGKFCAPEHAQDIRVSIGEGVGVDEGFGVRLVQVKRFSDLWRVVECSIACRGSVEDLTRHGVRARGRG